MNSFGFDEIIENPSVLMENPSRLILEISSDEEVGFGDTRKGGGYCAGGKEFGDRDGCDWLSELLGEVGGNKDDDSDDVVLVSETFPNPSKKPRLEHLKPFAKVAGDEGDDDDCVVLDGDPDKQVVAANGKVDDGGGGGGGGGDVEIVGEKGEVACRDFPHARHLCAKFLFSSTPHEVHCSQCHCYVCDSLAPCSHWGTSVSSINHCHATDKDEYWRAERKRMKKSGSLVLAVPHINNNSLLGRAFFQPTQALAQPHPVAPHFSSVSPNVNRPNALNQGRAHPVSVYRPRPQLVPLQSTVNKSPIFKRHGLVGASPHSIRPYGSQLSRNHPLSNLKKLLIKRRRVSQTPIVNGRHGTHQRNTGRHPVYFAQQINSPQGINVDRANYVPSQNQIHSRPYSNSLIRNSKHHQSQSQTHSEPYVNSIDFVSALPLQQPPVGSQPSVENLIFPQPHVFQPNSSANAGNAFGSELNSRFTIPSNQSAGNNLGSQSSQPQVHVNPSSLPFGIPIDFQQGNHTQNGIDSNPNTFGLAWDSSLIQTTAPAVNNSQLQSVKENNNRPSIEPVDSFLQEGVVVADNSSLPNDAGCQFLESIPHDTLDFQFGNWMFENHSLPGVLEVPVSPLWNAFSPEPASADTRFTKCVESLEIL